MRTIVRTTAFARLQSARAALNMADTLFSTVSGSSPGPFRAGQARTVTLLSGVQLVDVDGTNHDIHPAISPRGYLHPSTDLRSTGTAP